MIAGWRAALITSALAFAAGAHTASAQTVVVRAVPQGETVELVVNGSTVATATPNETGDATLTVPEKAGKDEMDATIYVDTCDKLRRVVLVERGQLAAPEGPCRRHEVVGIFWIRRRSTLVVNLSGANPAVLLRQGRIELRPLGAPVIPRTVPRGIVLFGGGGYSTIGDAATFGCGNVRGCEGDGSGGAYTGGVAVWLMRFLAAEGSYFRAADVTVSGSGANFQFTGELETEVFTLAGVLGIPIGPVRLYGKGGMNYHRATSTTVQTIDDLRVTVDGVERIIQGGTQTIELKTAGWSWLFGGGMEAWISRSFGLYADGGLLNLKGEANETSEVRFDDRVIYVVGGVRVRLGR